MKADGTGKVRVATRIQKRIEQGTFDNQGCSHLSQIQEVVPSAEGCEDCLKIGDKWVHLRICLTCGYVGCCDNSKNKHATRHHHATQHPVIASFQRGEDWIWCYPDQQFFQT